MITVFTKLMCYSTDFVRYSNSIKYRKVIRFTLNKSFYNTLLLNIFGLSIQIKVL